MDSQTYARFLEAVRQEVNMVTGPSTLPVLSEVSFSESLRKKIRRSLLSDNIKTVEEIKRQLTQPQLEEVIAKTCTRFCYNLDETPDERNSRFHDSVYVPNRLNRLLYSEVIKLLLNDGSGLFDYISKRKYRRYNLRQIKKTVNAYGVSRMSFVSFYHPDTNKFIAAIPVNHNLIKEYVYTAMEVIVAAYKSMTRVI